MKSNTWIASLALIGCLQGSAFAAESRDDHFAEEVQKGPHGGRLFREDEFAVELTIFETGVEPEFRAYAYKNDAPLDPDRLVLRVELKRLNAMEEFAFVAREDYLVGDAVVGEPHSFVVVVTAEYDGRTSRWTYDSFEGRTSITAASAAAAGIETEAAGPATVRESLVLHGIVVPDPTRVFRLRARYPGLVKEVRKRLGDTVAAGETVIVVESDESLQRYNIIAPSAGEIVSRDVNPGMLAADISLMTVADLSTVWVEPRVRKYTPVANFD
jgi:cobalt-zinc-cadmium efflux system membrane fusion protein